MTTTGPFFFFELLPPRPNAPALVDDDDNTDRCGRRRSAVRPAHRAATSVRREYTVADALVEAARQLEEGRALEARLDDRSRREAVGNVAVVVAARAAAAVDPHADAEVDAQQLPARLEAIEDANMEAQAMNSERASEETQSLFQKKKEKVI